MVSLQDFFPFVIKGDERIKDEQNAELCQAQYLFSVLYHVGIGMWFDGFYALGSGNIVGNRWS